MSAAEPPVVGDCDDPEQALVGSAPAQWAAQPAGDRGRPAVQSVTSVQARMTRVLAGLLLGALTAGLLVWYYARALNQPAAHRSHAQVASQNKAKGEMTLPPLGAFASFRQAVAAHRVLAEVTPAGSSRESIPPVSAAAVMPAQPTFPFVSGVSLPLATPAVAPARATGPHPGGGARVSAQQRRLGGHVFAGCAGACPADGTGCAGAGLIGATGCPGPAMGSAAASSQSTEPQSAGPAQPVPGATLLPKGWVLECTLETAIDSTLPGLTTCVTPVDVFGADGRVVLLPRGTQLVGETRGSVHQGQARIAVLWTEARTPAGVVVNLASSGTDALGRAGLAGEVERQFGERFGAAVLLSVIDGTISAALASQQRSGAVVVSPNASESVMTELLKETEGIAPRLVKAQGDRIAVLVARNIDFRSVLARTRDNRASEIAGAEHAANP